MQRVKCLEMHQRRYPVIEKMHEDQRSEFEIWNNDASGKLTNEQEIYVDKLVNVQIKPGMKLPRSIDEWTTANEFFKTVLGNVQFNETSNDTTIEFINNTIYDYFQSVWYRYFY